MDVKVDMVNGTNLSNLTILTALWDAGAITPAGVLETIAWMRGVHGEIGPITDSLLESMEGNARAYAEAQTPDGRPPRGWRPRVIQDDD